MAHYLAEQMVALETKSGQEKADCEATVTTLILQVWERRNKLPVERVPFLDVDKVTSALERLAPGRGEGAYFGIFNSGRKPDSQDMDVDFLLKTALLVDRIAGDLVRTLVVHAAKSAEDSEASWVKCAEKVGDNSLTMMRRLDVYRSVKADSVNDDIQCIKDKANKMSDLLDILSDYLS
ncbi:hypothetical protein HMPREF9997_00098 [Corynebacterium durum F0235]|uniref:Uncharacterized protein n=2 Tax=Corynebacterium durum TaxID=61592 RepID=L1MMH4_9CORY|nr:hypothetical protein HMPREF9997_00098 [Corynebacterium durum F0235]